MKRIVITLCLAILFTSIVPVGVANALSTDWKGGTGDWSTGANWSLGEPLASDTASIHNGGTAQITQSGETSLNLHIGLFLGSSGNVTMSGGSLSVANVDLIGTNGTGVFNQSGGTHTILNFFGVGINASGIGTYNLSGTGSLVASGETIGGFGTGSFTQTGGTHTASNLQLGNQSGSSGTYDLSGTGSLAASLEVVGNFGSGTFTQTGGTNTISTDLRIGNSAGGNGTYTISGGTLDVGGTILNGAGTGTLNIDGGTVNAGTIGVDNLNIANSTGTNVSHTLGVGESISAGQEVIGNSGTGAFTQTGGTNTISNIFQLGANTVGSSGSYDLSGTGSLTVNNSEFIGNFGTGTFTQTGGTNSVTNTLFIGNSAGGSGTYNLGGTGSLSATDENIGWEGSGGFTQTGGTNTISNNFQVGANTGGSGTYDLSGTGSLAANNEFIGNFGTGTFTQAGGTNTVTNNLFIGNSVVGNGTYTISGGTLDVGSSIVNGAGTGTLNIDGGTVSAGAIGVDTLNIANSAGTNGSHTLGVGESINVSSETIGRLGTGTFIQTGGTHTISSDLQVGIFSGSSGSYDLSGTGNLTASSEFIGFIGNSIGTFTQSSGTHTVANDLNLGVIAGSSGTYSISGGNLSANNSYVGGTSSGSGGNGTMNVSGAGDALISVALKLWDAGVVNLSGGMLKAGTIDNTNGGTFNMTGGTLAVDTFMGNLAMTGGTLAPGNSPGTTSVFGDYSQDINSTLQIEIGGLLAGIEHDVLDVSGILNLGGTLEVLLYGGFNPLAGDTFDILNWGSLAGVFDFLLMPSLMGDLFWDTSALYTTGELSVASTAIPEPSTVALLGIGLAGLAGMYLRRRRIKKSTVGSRQKANK